MSDRNPVVRTRALEAFRKTVGLEMGSAVNVNVSQRTTVSNGQQPTSFEQVMDKVRERLLAERREQALIAAPGDASISARVRSE